MEKINKVINFYSKNGKNITINNIHYFLYSKIVWEPYITSVLNAHGVKAIEGSDDMDIDTADILIYSTKNNYYYGVDIKMCVYSMFKQKTKCVAVNKRFFVNITNASTANKFILFWAYASLYVVPIHSLADIEGHYVLRGQNYMYEYLLSDILSLPSCKELCLLTSQELTALVQYKKTLDASHKSKVPLLLDIPNEMKIEKCNKALKDMGLDLYYNIYYNFVSK